MSDDWKKDVPFPRHWLVYLILKIALILFAVYLAFKLGFLWQ